VLEGRCELKIVLSVNRVDGSTVELISVGTTEEASLVNSVGKTLLGLGVVSTGMELVASLEGFCVVSTGLELLGSLDGFLVEADVGNSVFDDVGLIVELPSVLIASLVNSVGKTLLGFGVVSTGLELLASVEGFCVVSTGPELLASVDGFCVVSTGMELVALLEGFWEDPDVGNSVFGDVGLFVDDGLAEVGFSEVGSSVCVDVSDVEGTFVELSTGLEV
jgi:hypothetical protein